MLKERIIEGERLQDLRDTTAVGFVEGILGKGVVDPDFEPEKLSTEKFRDLSDEIFPEFLANALITYMNHQIVSTSRDSGEKPVTFIPTFSFYHKDGAEMVTVGGIISSTDNIEEWKSILKNHSLLGIKDGKPEFQRLDLIPITLKEKLGLDGCLPYTEEEFIGQAKELGLKINDETLVKYRRYYRHFSVFVESPL